MASYSLLGALAGFRYSAVEKTLWVAPQLQVRPFNCFFSTASAYGSIELGQKSLHVRVIEGELEIEKLVLAGSAHDGTHNWKTVIHQGSSAEMTLVG
jgi:hypothetical protein